MGISDIPGCRPYDFLCQVARRAAKQAVYGEWAQANLVQVIVIAALFSVFPTHVCLCRRNISAILGITKNTWLQITSLLQSTMKFPIPAIRPMHKTCLL